MSELFTHLCKFDVLVDNPPKEDAIVLNSTCFTWKEGGEDVVS